LRDISQPYIITFYGTCLWLVYGFINNCETYHKHIITIYGTCLWLVYGFINNCENNNETYHTYIHNQSHKSFRDLYMVSLTIARIIRTHITNIYTTNLITVLVTCLWLVYGFNNNCENNNETYHTYIHNQSRYSFVWIIIVSWTEVISLLISLLPNCKPFIRHCLRQYTINTFQILIYQ
jgi:hypothetical protein